MKRLSLAIILACCTLAVAAQEDGFRVNYQGAKPTIKDFALAYITSLISEAEECDEEGMSLYENLQDAIKCQAKGLPLESNSTLTIDQKNGFLVYERCATGTKPTENTNCLPVTDGVSRMENL